MQEWLAMRLKAHLLAQPARPDGRDPAKITGRFRADFRLAILGSHYSQTSNISNWGQNL